jgi:hypothetical protein
VEGGVDSGSGDRETNVADRCALSLLVQFPGDTARSPPTLSRRGIKLNSRGDDCRCARRELAKNACVI